MEAPVRNTDRKDTDFLKFVAIILIVNSHCDPFYPIPGLATGGAIGNSLFFSLWGFGLYLSHQKIHRSFREWIGKRFWRIYPTTWVTLILIEFPRRIFSNELTYGNLFESLGMFFYPPYWFLDAILFYAFPVYFIMQHKARKRIMVTTVLIAFL